MIGILVKFLIGSLILILSTQLLVIYAKKTSIALKISPLIIGLTIIAIGTSLPELSISLTAIYKQDVGMAMGNIVGSNIINILFVFGVGILIGKLKVGTSKTQKNSIFLLASTLIFVILQLTNIPAQTSGIILIVMAIIITIVGYLMGINGRENEDKNMFVNNQKVKIEPFILIMPIILIAGVISGSLIVVSSAEEFSILTAISTTVVGLSLTAITTSLPELLTTIFSQKDHQGKLTLGNILGSNIYNVLLIGGLVNLLYGRNGIATKNWIFLIATTFFFVFILNKFSGKTIPKIYGVILLVAFLLYLATLGWQPSIV